MIKSSIAILLAGAVIWIIAYALGSIADRMGRR
jgi:hypothetical protein